MDTLTPGTTKTVELEFTNAVTGVATDPATVQLDITFGSAFGSGLPDFAGPFSFTGASGPTAGQVYRMGTGLYAYDWPIPAGAPGGVYVANWSVTYGGEPFGAVENFFVQGGATTTPPNTGDIGWWTGSISYNGLQLNFGAQDAAGTAWALLGVDGMGGAPTDGQVIQKSGDHGGYATPQFYAARPLTLRVRAAASSWAERDAARAYLQQIIPVSDLATLVVGEAIPKTLQVRRSGVVTEVSKTLTTVTFAAGLIAPDPRKYGAPSSTTVIANSQTLGVVLPLTLPVTFPAQAPPGAATVTNGGNFETRPQITITGPITGPAVYNQTSGQTVSFSTLTLGVADQLVVDLLAKVAYLNGAQASADLWSSWWVLEPGTSQVILQGAGGAGATMTITFNDAWM